MCAVSGAVSKQLVRIDSKYGALFNDSTWKESTADRLDMSTRFGQYSELMDNCFTLQLSCMLCADYLCSKHEQMQ